MSNYIKSTLALAIQGLRDSIVGTANIYHLDKLDQEDEKKDAKTEEPLSTLARRRADRMKPKHEPKVRQRILLCCAWNGGLFWLSIWLFNNLIIPSLEFLTHLIFGGSATHNMVWAYIGPMLSWTFGALWVLPLFVLSKVINSLWFQDIADAAYRKSRGRPQMLPSLSKIIADILFSLLLQSLFLIQGMLVNLLPIQWIGDFVSLLHVCLLYSLYAFEYKWFNMGWEIHKRLSYIENNWPYFLGFGLPLAVLTSLPESYIVSGCVFSILFPLFIISGNEAEPLNQNYDFPLRVFSVVIRLSNLVFQQSVKKSETPRSQPATPKKHVTLQR
ncbi:hypothetical protein CAPTEDRAFT_158464 [Capitella teleta]|uniref:Etoposide-induced protein 2.4 homolog n=1 Tax=Capitella teleta TaxID=283909 RepID=R7TPI8_CAPTE|nr:hypothetical protein CAPTEDRAFT_158464 [Capitella teleta]|eukprot:ELT92960.1 hypothetical protein CAPTEDRAFT_158464 [Capitella teleta]